MTANDPSPKPWIFPARIITYSLLLIWLCEYFLIQPARITVDQLPPPEPEIESLTGRLRDHVTFLASPELRGRAPGTPGNTRAEHYLLQQFQDIGLVSPSPSGSRTQTITPEIGNNVFSALTPMQADHPWLLLGAHFDHVGEQDGFIHPGADDNASSVAVLLETARLLTQGEPLRKFNLLFAGFNSEESPYFLTRWMGSHHFYNHIEETGIQPSALRLAVIMDILGGVFWEPLKDTLFVMGAEKSPGLESVISAINQPRLQVQPLGISMIENIPGQGQHIFGDYQVFRMNKIPYLFLSAGRTPHYHRKSDTAGKLNYSRLARTTLWLAKLIQNLDRQDGRWTYEPKRIHLEQDFKTLAPLVEKASAWSTRIPQTGPISLYQLKRNAADFKTMGEKLKEGKTLTQEDAKRLELASIRIQCLLGKMGPCFLLSGGG